MKWSSDVLTFNHFKAFAMTMSFASDAFFSACRCSNLMPSRWMPGPEMTKRPKNVRELRSAFGVVAMAVKPCFCSCSLRIVAGGVESPASCCWVASWLRGRGEVALWLGRVLLTLPLSSRFVWEDMLPLGVCSRCFIFGCGREGREGEWEVGDSVCVVGSNLRMTAKEYFRTR